MGQIHLERSRGFAVVRFDNPPHGFLDGAMAAALEDQLARLADVPDVRTLILTGKQEDVFIRHFDLPELARAADAVAAAGGDREVDWSSSIFHRITRQLETMPQIVIAAINGHCMGVGYELALACDLRIASAGKHSIGMPEAHIAMFPGGGGTVRLARLLGASRAVELICTATTVSPRQALDLGMVDRLAPDAMAAAMELAGKIGSLSPGLAAEAKRIIHASTDLPIEDALTMEQRAVNARLGSAEVRSLLHRFVESGGDLRYPIDRQP